MAIPGNIRIKDFDYPLPPERIAQFPLENRDASKLLIWEKGKIRESLFSAIGSELPSGSILVFNDTRVIHARLIFSKSTGATIEIFCLEPLEPTTNIATAFAQSGSCTWNCLIGNVKRWKEGILEKTFSQNGQSWILTARKKENLGDGCFSVEFCWEPSMLSFSAIIERAGLVPLPPYITRASVPLDDTRYQTIYAKNEGSVAAPTAGLHFTEGILYTLKKKNISFGHVTLHVGIGTFRPVSADDIASHIMHAEKISVRISLIRDLIGKDRRKVMAVGTTSVRTLESLYWLGVKLITGGKDQFPVVNQWDPYDPDLDTGITASDALNALKTWLENNGQENYSGSTSLMIVPGYRFRIVDGIITNFHMPQSTLLLLVAAFAGDSWRSAYDYALRNDFRFLSYGDACLFF
ncbi:MAG: S-adenosylmethionine:tRNA ribosyltransferase-isomerase [Bacteroidetes bacterium]|nr:S-adenosylmethionine:tRNA ribosyltransferase-isomerase [Bacteroidota bacterium]